MNIKINYLNKEWKKQHSIHADMCNYAIQISKPTERIGFYENIILTDKYTDVESAVKKANDVQEILKVIDSYIQVSVIESLI